MHRSRRVYLVEHCFATACVRWQRSHRLRDSGEWARLGAEERAARWLTAANGG